MSEKMRSEAVVALCRLREEFSKKEEEMIER